MPARISSDAFSYRLSVVAVWSATQPIRRGWSSLRCRNSRGGTGGAGLARRRGPPAGRRAGLRRARAARPVRAWLGWAATRRAMRRGVRSLRRAGAWSSRPGSPWPACWCSGACCCGEAGPTPSSTSACRPGGRRSPAAHRAGRGGRGARRGSAGRPRRGLSWSPGAASSGRWSSWGRSCRATPPTPRRSWPAGRAGPPTPRTARPPGRPPAGSRPRRRRTPGRRWRPP